jgi:N-acetyl-alpha-D-glucosaminyl L-malate synthase BshA
VIHISNMRPVKRIPDVIEIFHRIAQEEDAILLMLGDGPERERAEQQVRDLGIAEKVRFLGKTTEVRRLLCMSDLFLLTSEKESFGLVALEAMAAKVPVVSTNSGGIPEVNIHGVTGYLASPGAVEEMAAHGLSLLQDEEKLAQFKQQAFEHAKKFSIEKIVPMYEEAYEKALAAVR